MKSALEKNILKSHHAGWWLLLLLNLWFWALLWSCPKFVTHKWLFSDHFYPFFCQLHENLSQNWGSDGHFEGLNRSTSFFFYPGLRRFLLTGKAFDLEYLHQCPITHNGVSVVKFIANIYNLKKKAVWVLKSKKFGQISLYSKECQESSEFRITFCILKTFFVLVGKLWQVFYSYNSKSDILYWPNHRMNFILFELTLTYIL